MPVTTDQYQRILSRLSKLEETANDIMVAMERLVTLTQVNQLLTLIQTDLVDIRETLESLENRVSNIEEEDNL